MRRRIRRNGVPPKNNGPKRTEHVVSKAIGSIGRNIGNVSDSDGVSIVKTIVFEYLSIKGCTIERPKEGRLITNIILRIESK